MLRDAREDDDITSGIMVEAMSRVLPVKLLQRYGKRQPGEVALTVRFTSEHYKRVLDLIRAHLDQTIALDDLAGEAGMPPSHFSRIFKETLGMTPIPYVMACRIEQAIEMMQDPARSLGNIALASGFADQAHFSHGFKQLTGN
jgi:AraC family transcriptional regulator